MRKEERVKQLEAKQYEKNPTEIKIYYYQNGAYTDTDGEIISREEIEAKDILDNKRGVISQIVIEFIWVSNKIRLEKLEESIGGDVEKSIFIYIEYI